MIKNVIPALVLALAATAFPALAHADTLYSDFSRRGTVKIHVAPPVDATGKDQILIAEFKKSIEEALAARKSVRFAVVPSESEADVVVESRVTGFSWTDHDPVDMIVGIGAAALDAAKVECYARMNVTFLVKDAKSGRKLWNEALSATVTKAKMSEKESLSLINSDMAKQFVIRAFGKSKGRR